MINDLRARLGIFRSIAIYYWKPFNRSRLKRFYAQFIKPNDLCFDIGAHLGNRTDAWHLLGAKIVALEPQPKCMAYMQKRFNEKQNITLLEKAVGKKAGKTSFFVSELTPTISTMSDEKWREIIADDTSFKIAWDKEIEVEVVTLDQLIEEYGVPKFCKIDVENFELEVLNGLSYPIPALSVEYYSTNIENTIKCIDRLESLANYEYNWTNAEKQKFNSKNWLSAEQLKTIFLKFNESGLSGDFYARFSTENQ
jgi:FkbM family methyltransferase